MLTLSLTLLILGVVSVFLGRFIYNHQLEAYRQEAYRQQEYSDVMLMLQDYAGAQTHGTVYYSPVRDELVTLTGDGRIFTQYGDRETNITPEALLRAGYEPIGDYQ